MSLPLCKLGAFALALLASACAAAPSAVDPKALAATAPETERQSIARMMQITSHLQQSQFLPGNRVTLLRNGDETYPAMLAAILGAKQRIDMESYQFDTEGAALFAPALLQRAQAGVQVHLIYDAWGSSSQDKALFARLRAAGAQVVEFNPIGSKLNPDHRDHRKLLVVDDQIAITGGINITGVYLNRTSRSASDPAKMRWRDTDVRIEGPVVAQFQRLFVKTWVAEKGPPLPEPPPAPTAMRGPSLVEAIDGAPNDNHPVIYETLLSAVALAKHSIHLTTGFFGPPPELLHALADAARRGVDVALITAAHSDSNASIAAGRSHFHELLRAGVRIYELQGAVLHAKTGVVDGLWAFVGSSNLDWRSTVLNNEIDAVIIDREFGAKMDAMFADDVAHSRQITPQAWADRGLGERASEWWARIIEEEL